ncbi:MAG: hypothetical protein HOP28_00470 [Gemmatimonadales bacterium]|nr:hypothetical protein [Gemmatimonadales bacterium]
MKSLNGANGGKPAVRYSRHHSGITVRLVHPPIVGPGERTCVRVYVHNDASEPARNVTAALTDSGDITSSGVTMKHLGHLAPGGSCEAELTLRYAIVDSLRLAALTIAAFPRAQAIDWADPDANGALLPSARSGRLTAAIHPSRTSP